MVQVGGMRLSRAAIRALSFCAVLVPGQVFGDEPPAVDIADLPPLPEVEGDDSSLLDVAVEGASHVEEYVVVGASKREQSLGTVASAVTVIPADQLRRMGYRDVAEALRGVVGLYVVDDRMIERVGIRGLQLLGDANTRILVLVDGTTINEPWSQYVDTSTALPVHLDDVARIEVIRGPVSSIYGTNAFLGIINIVTIEADKAPKAYGRLTAGSYGTVGGNAAFGTGGVNRQVRGFVSWLGDAGESVDYPEFADDGGFVSTGADATHALHGAVAVHFDRVFGQVRASQRSRELPGAPYDSVAGSEDNVNRDRHLMGEVGYTQDVGDLTVATRVYVNLYQFKTSLDLELEGSASGVPQPFESTATSLWYGGEVRGLYPVLPDGKLDVTAGIAGELANTETESFLVNAPGDVTSVDESFNIAGVYTEVTSQPLPWLGATGGVRYDRNSLFDNRLSPRGALFLTHGKKYGLKLLYAKGFRNPSVFERFYDDGQRYLPNLGVKLLPESITSYEVVAWAQPRPGLNLRLSGWQWDLEDLIEKRSPFIADVMATRFQFQNLGQAQSRGVELESSYRDTRGWFGRLGASYAEVTRNEGFEDPINAPEITANAAVSTPALFGLVHASLELLFVGARNTRDDDVDVDAWTGLNATLYVPDYHGFDFAIGGRNLLGTREQIPAQTDYDRVRDDGGTLRDVPVYTLPGAGIEAFVRVGYRY